MSMKMIRRSFLQGVGKILGMVGLYGATAAEEGDASGTTCKAAPPTFGPCRTCSEWWDDDDPCSTPGHGNMGFCEYRDEPCCGAAQRDGCEGYNRLIEHIGFHLDRVRCEHNPLEAALVECWRKENQPLGRTPTLWSLLCRDPWSLLRSESERPDALRYVTQRDARVAATIVQWMGTNCGRDFLERAYREAGWNLTFRRRSDRP